MQNIYLDYNATAPLLPEVIESMYEFSKNNYGNPSSIHFLGRKAKKAIDEAKEHIAKLIGCSATEILFTSGGTEANNLAVLGLLRASKKSSRHFITTSIEHKSVLDAAKKIETEAVHVSFLSVNRNGRINIDELTKELRQDTALVSIMAANNEVGTVQDIASIASIVRKSGVLFHCDMVQALGKMPINLSSLPIDFATISAHKIGGPKGIGALICRNKSEIEPLIYGGKQAGGIRPGTENTLGIIGFGTAAKTKLNSIEKSLTAMRILRTQFIKGIGENISSAKMNGDLENGLPNTISVSFPGCDIDTLLMSLDSFGVAVGVGSACSAGIGKASHVLVAMGLEKECLDCTLRISMGDSTTSEDVENSIKLIVEAVQMSELGGAT